MGWSRGITFKILTARLGLFVQISQIHFHKKNYLISLSSTSSLIISFPFLRDIYYAKYYGQGEGVIKNWKGERKTGGNYIKKNGEKGIFWVINSKFPPSPAANLFAGGKNESHINNWIFRETKLWTDTRKRSMSASFSSFSCSVRVTYILHSIIISSKTKSLKY